MLFLFFGVPNPFQPIVNVSSPTFLVSLLVSNGEEAKNVGQTEGGEKKQLPRQKPDGGVSQ